MNSHRGLFDIIRGQKGKFLTVFILQLSLIRNDRHSDGLRSGRPEFDSRHEQEIFLFYHSAQNESGAHPASCRMRTTGVPME